MDLERFTDRCKGFMENARIIAKRLNHQQLLNEHLLQVLIEDQEGIASNLLESSGGNVKLMVKIQKFIRQIMSYVQFMFQMVIMK